MGKNDLKNANTLREMKCDNFSDWESYFYAVKYDSDEQANNMVRAIKDVFDDDAWVTADRRVIPYSLLRSSHLKSSTELVERKLHALYELRGYLLEKIGAAYNRKFRERYEQYKSLRKEQDHRGWHLIPIDSNLSDEYDRIYKRTRLYRYGTYYSDLDHDGNSWYDLL